MPAPIRTDMDLIVSALAASSFRYSRETQLHLGIEQCLVAAGFEPKSEQRITGGRIDFLVNRVGVEVKIKGTAADLLAQLVRYSVEESIDALLVVTTRVRHRDLPRELNGKPVRVILIGGNL